MAEAIPFLARKDIVLEALRRADRFEIAEAVQNIEEDQNFCKRNFGSSSLGGKMSLAERKKKYDEFYEALTIVAKERFSDDDLIRILRLGRKVEKG